MSRTLTIKHNDKLYEGIIGTIDKTYLGWEDHGVFTALLTFSSGSTGVNLGGYTLAGRSRNSNSLGTSFGIDHIQQIMKTAGVDNWEALTGTQVITLFDPDTQKAVGIAHISDEDKVLIFKEHADLYL